ncbi:uncharacterized protein BDZ99DRAFT_117043 [Mytilinidion resinicola]|uniref:Uncharacterized protein n=1 Tax=Mytilinidion resinicola TaxID=574789 RepID=A0A6A6Y9I2_9PEZI|nr:uncharacterized protein BDZ99DRAFT_117043 [Mytilinidion resinicola]KAF2805289.1 hypothetical protein BDZ99DRAFT_117043 [Mytilinidion resinicola]
MFSSHLLYLIYVSPGTTVGVTSETSLMLHNVHLRVINLQSGIPLNVRASHEFSPNQETQVNFRTADGTRLSLSIVVAYLARYVWVPGMQMGRLLRLALNK